MYNSKWISFNVLVQGSPLIPFEHFIKGGYFSYGFNLNPHKIPSFVIFEFGTAFYTLTKHY